MIGAVGSAICKACARFVGRHQFARRGLAALPMMEDAVQTAQLRRVSRCAIVAFRTAKGRAFAVRKPTNWRATRARNV
jgi:hypothetical protein